VRTVISPLDELGIFKVADTETDYLGVSSSREVTDIFRAAGPTYRATHSGHLSLAQLNVLSAVERCRTADLGGHVEACEDCGHIHVHIISTQYNFYAKTTR